MFEMLLSGKPENAIKLSLVRISRFFAIPLTIFLLLSGVAFAQKGSADRRVDSSTWTPAMAETVRARTANRQIEAVQSTLGTKEIFEANKRLLEERTGFGSIPHAPLERDEQAIRQQALWLSELQRQVASQAKSLKIPRSGVMEGMMPVSDAPVVSMMLKTPSLGALTGGGWVYAFDPVSLGYLGYSAIGGDGTISLPLAGGESIDLLVFPSPPFAFQVARKITFLPGQDLMLKDAVEKSITVTDLDDKVLSGVNTNLQLTLNSYFGYNFQVGVIAGSGSIYLAPGESYQLSATPDFPYLFGDSTQVDSTSPPVVFKVEEGVIVSIEFDDPDHLLGQAGCVSSGRMDLHSSQNVLEYKWLQLSSPQAQFDESSNLVGFKVAVPERVAVDYVIRFNANPGNCLLEDIFARFVWFSGSQTIHFQLKPRPLPEILLQTPSGDPLDYDSGTIYSEDIFGHTDNFAPGWMPSLIAGQTYFVNVRKSGKFSVNETRVVAQPGNFTVVVEAEPLVSVKGRVNLAGNVDVTALIELYRNGVLVEAFEYHGGDVTMEIPAGTYDVRLSGIVGRHYQGNRHYIVILQPLMEQRTVTGIEGERMEFSLDIPTNGVQFKLQYPGTYQFFADEGGTIQAVGEFGTWIGGILSDYDQFNMVIRGPGFEDDKITITPAVDFPMVDLASVQGPIGRLKGTVVDQDQNPIEGVQIDLYGEDGTVGWSYTSTGPSGTFDVPKIKNGLIIFNAPDAGDSIMVFEPVINPLVTDEKQITMTKLDFHDVSETGPVKQLLYGSGNRGYSIVFLSEAYVSEKESFTDSNLNGVWDGVMFMDYNQNGLWEQNEPYRTYGERKVNHNSEVGTNVKASDEAFTDDNGDGYPNIDDFAVFVQNAKNYIRSLLGTPDIRDNVSFDAYIVFLPSFQAGQDVIDTSDVKIIDWGTRFGGAVLLKSGMLSVDEAQVNRALEVHAPERDLTVVMLNQPVPVGRENAFILASGGLSNSNPNSMVAGHEFGHNPGGLQDEYNEFNGTSLNYFSPTLRHLTHRTETADIPWFDFLDGHSSLPVSAPNTPGNGVFAGGFYHAGGAYRSTANSRMRHTAPLFNDISLDFLRQSLCLVSLTDSDFIGRSPDGIEAFPSNGVVELCESQPAFQINAGLNDAWYYPVTNGQGFFINVFPALGYVSLSWFTYDTARPAAGVAANLGESGHRWLNAVGQYAGNQAVLNISYASGGLFDSSTPVTEITDGTIILTFSDCNNGTVEYDIPSIGQKGTVPIQRVAADNIALCESLSQQAPSPQSSPARKTGGNAHLHSGDPAAKVAAASLTKMNAGLNDAWYYPVTNGQGFFINVFPALGYVNLSWFTYDTVRPPEGVTAKLGEPGHRWLNALGQISDNKAVMQVSYAKGGLFDSPTPVNEVIDGTITLTFSDCNSGTVEYNLPSINRQGTVPIQRVAADNITLCEALNAD